MKKPITREKLSWWGRALVHPFDGFYEIRFRGRGSLLLAFLLMLLFGIMRCLSAQYTGFVMNFTNQDEIDTLSLFISSVSVLLLFSLSNWTVTTLFNGKGKLSDIYIVLCYSLTVLIVGDALVCFVSNFVTTEEIMILQAVRMLCIVWFAFLVVAGLGTIHEYGLGGNLASIVLSVAAAAIILFIGVLLFAMLERMVSFFTSVGQELMRRL